MLSRVAITLWCLATTCEYRTIAHLFGIGRSTLCGIVHETCDAIVSLLIGTYIVFPTGECLRRVVDGFENKWGYPQCAGAIDGCHIPISAPALNHTDYYNRKGWYSMVVQAIVDHDYIFRDICVGWPGSVHDARIFANSLIYKRITEDHILSDGECRTIHGCEIPINIIGDSAYPIQPWLMKPFGDGPSLSPREKCFNYRLSRARIVVENAFGRLKARWRHMMKKNDTSIKHIPTVISACCILHNMCELHGQTFNETWLNDVEEHGRGSESGQPASFQQRCQSTTQNIRNALSQYFYEQQ